METMTYNMCFWNGINVEDFSAIYTEFGHGIILDFCAMISVPNRRKNDDKSKSNSAKRMHTGLGHIGHAMNTADFEPFFACVYIL